jgi:hypothetical protein
MTARMITVTLGSGATQISTTAAPFNQMVVQNIGSASANLGDATVSATIGIELAASAAANSIVSIGPFSGQQGDASQYWLYGTSGQKVAVLLT